MNETARRRRLNMIRRSAQALQVEEDGADPVEPDHDEANPARATAGGAAVAARRGLAGPGATDKYG